MADYNQMLVLDLIRRSTGISRVELVRETGLTAQTMSNICRRLEGSGLIRETGRHHGGSGAPRAIFKVEASGLYAIGLHIDPARLTFVVVDLAGNTVARRQLPTPDQPEPEPVLAEIEASIRELIAETSVPLERIAGIGVATPGPIDAAEGAVVGAPNLPGWKLVRLRHELQLRLKLPVVIEKDSTAAALGERWARSPAYENFAFIYLGTGVSAGIVLDGEVMRGTSGNMGDIGHLSGDPNGPICPCGGRGCLALTAMPASLVAEATSNGLLTEVDISDAHAVELALAELCRLAEGAPRGAAARIVTRAARSYARVTGQLANILDLEAVVFGGPQWQAFEPAFSRVVPDVVSRLFVGRALHPVAIQGSVVGADSGAYGAASMAMWSITLDAPSQLYLPRVEGL